MPKSLPELPMIYQVALMHESNKVGKTRLQIILEAIDLWLEKNNPSYARPSEHNPKEAFSRQEQVVTTITSHLNIIPTDSAYGLLLEQDNAYLIENRKYQTLESALIQIKEYEKQGGINSTDWNTTSGKYPLVILQKGNGTPHLWLGQNTACKIFNNPIMKPEGFTLSKILPTQNICKVCATNYKDIKSPKIQLTFDNNKRLLPSNFDNVDPLF